MNKFDTRCVERSFVMEFLRDKTGMEDIRDSSGRDETEMAWAP